ncbi:MAG: AzlC family ABC transporter permease [Clostridia bacterium]|nr:AzlC family ABC transporter permease [Clostridia bacterium]
MDKKKFLQGMRDGLPIGLGYLAVGFSIGITCHRIGLNVFQSFLLSFLNNASAGEYAGMKVMEEDAGILSMIIMMLIVNGRYLLMSCALSQKLPQSMPLVFRMIIGFDVTDEMFGISIAQPGYLNEWYFIGAMCMAIPGWSAGTVIGVMLGNIMPALLVSAFSIMLFGMFIAIIIPVGKADKKVLLCILVSFIASFAFSRLSTLSSGLQTIILTLVISVAAALIFPKKEEDEQ